MRESFDTIVVGAGIAGLGVAAILASEAGEKVLVLDRYDRPGGRLMSYPDTPGKGWKVDIGLHMTELGDASSIHALNERVGEQVAWGPFSETVQFYHEGRFINIAELVPMSGDERRAFGSTLRLIAELGDAEIAAWDDRSLAEWLVENVSSEAVRDLFADMGMIMTTIPEAIDMAAGEVLYIGRDNLRKKSQLLTSSYPIGGMEALTRGLVRVIEDNWGRVETGREVTEVMFAGGRTTGVKASRHKPEGPYPGYYAMPQPEEIEAGKVVCALPIYQLPAIIDFAPATSPMPSWWTKRITDIMHEVTCLVGFMFGLSEPVTDKLCFFTALETPHAGLPFQAFPASNFDPAVAPAGKQLLHTDVVCEYPEASDPFERRRILGRLWQDLLEMFPGIEDAVEWKIPYHVVGCDGLARKPGLVGEFKPKLQAPGIENLFFAGDTYIGRGLAMNGAALSGMQCADLILDRMA
ncbi:MAG: NAD(P)/FAD-dependent oxidoreductase [Actinobacteria bacterium]|nr:NAD(P)/FAD-dependent oxidoreductase [Actinomycetota bacterium]